MHRLDAAAAGVGVEARDIGAGQKRHVVVRRQHRIDADHLRIGLAVEQAWEAVEGAAAHADAGRRGEAVVLLVEQDAERQVERLQADPRQPIGQFRHLGLVFDGGERIGPGGRRLIRVFAALAVDVKQTLRLVVVGCERGILQRPRGGDPARMLDLVKIALAQPEKCGAVDLGVAADIVVERRTEGLAAGVGPGLGRLVFAVDEDGLGAPVRLLARQIAAAFEDQNPFAGQAPGDGRAKRRQVRCRLR